MINRRLRREVKLGQSVKAGSTPLLQRKCACGAASGLSTCNECSGKSAAPHSTEVQRSTIPGHDFSHLPIYPANATTGTTLLFDGPDAPKTDAPKAPPPPKTPPPKQTPPAPQATCPTDIQVSRIVQIPDPDFGKPDGFKTGVGAVAFMEVSGPGRTDWDGIKIKESVKQTKNTCGARARDVCSNKSGGGEFEVGKESDILGKGKASAAKNTFHDLHIFAKKEVSVLHEKGLATCEAECEQTYSCGAKQIGPTFTITYNATRDTVAKTFDVTRVTVAKSAKAAPATPPPPKP